MDDAAAIEAGREALARLRRWGGGNDALARTLAALFADGVAARTAAIRAGIAAGDREAIASAAHALKATCGQIGAVDAEALCRAIETSDADVQALAPLAERLDAACAAFLAWLDHELANTAIA